MSTTFVTLYTNSLGADDQYYYDGGLKCRTVQVDIMCGLSGTYNTLSWQTQYAVLQYLVK